MIRFHRLERERLACPFASVAMQTNLAPEINCQLHHGTRASETPASSRFDASIDKGRTDE